MSEWKEYKFSEFVQVNPKVIFDQRENIPFVEMKNLEPSNKFCSYSSFRKIGGGSRFENGDTLFARITPCLENGKISQVRNLPGDKGLGSTEFHVLRGKTKISNTNFIYYLSRWSDVRDFAEINLHGTSGRQRFPAEAFNELSLLLPPLPEQERIAEVLSSLDDKIDLLHKQNKTLEEIAETLFRQWFVEEADDSWEEKSLDQIAEYLNGLALQKFPAQKGEPSLPAIKIREMNQGITGTTDRVSCNLPEKYIIENGDILFSWSGSLDVIIWTGGKGALNQHLFKVTSDKYPKWLIYFATRSFLPEFRDIANDKATTMGHIQRGHLSQSIVKLPKCEIIDKFDRIISDPFDKIIRNKLQIQQLESLRDTLLPKLMSGELRVN